MCGVTLRSGAVLLSHVDVRSVFQIVRHNTLRWFGYVGRKSDDDWVKKCQQLLVDGKALVEGEVGRRE